MPNATFLVELNLETIDAVNLAEETENLQTLLESEFDVVEVKPWAHPTVGPVTTTGAAPLGSQ